MHNDISKKTVLVLLVLTLVVSVIGTWSVLSMPTTVYKTVTQDGVENGRVSVGIVAPAQPVMPAEEGGRVSLSILKK